MATDDSSPRTEPRPNAHADAASSASFEDESPTDRLLRTGYRWLKFPEPLESQYRDDHRAASHRMVRMSLIVALITTAGFAFIDHQVIHMINATPDIVRFGLQFPVLLISLLASSRRFYFRWHEHSIRIGAPLFGLGSLLMAVNAAPDQVALVGARLLLVNFFIYFMLGLRMRTAVAINTFIFCALSLSGLAGWMDGSIASYLAFALFCANIIGGSGAYALEHASRTAFLERLSLEEVAARDGLTRLLNRQTFELRAGAVWRNNSSLQRSLAVLMIDVDYFKRYNDRYGHQAGDVCLRRVAATVKDSISPRSEELVGRYGGEELIALLVDRTPAEIDAIAKNIVTQIHAQHIPHEASIVNEYVTVSVGAAYTIAGADIGYAALANISDQALYQAKGQGRNRSIALDSRREVASHVATDDNSRRPESRASVVMANSVTP